MQKIVSFKWLIEYNINFKLKKIYSYSGSIIEDKGAFESSRSFAHELAHKYLVISYFILIIPNI